MLTVQGLEPDSMTETIHARTPTPHAAEVLRLSAGEAVMVLRRRTFTRDGRLVELARDIHAAARFAWSYTFTIPD